MCVQGVTSARLATRARSLARSACRRYRGASRVAFARRQLPSLGRCCESRRGTWAQGRTGVTGPRHGSAVQAERRASSSRRRARRRRIHRELPPSPRGRSGGQTTRARHPPEAEGADEGRHAGRQAGRQAGHIEMDDIRVTITVSHADEFDDHPSACRSCCSFCALSVLQRRSRCQIRWWWGGCFGELTGVTALALACCYASMRWEPGQSPRYTHDGDS